MTYLRNHCLGRLPLEQSTVEIIYETIATAPLDVLRRRTTELCFSHERQRAELVGLGVVWDEYKEIVDRLKERIKQEREAGMGHHVDLLESILNPPKTEQQP